MKDSKLYKRNELNIYEGFDSVEEAKEFLLNYGFANVEGFVFISIVNNDKINIYPVAMETLKLQILFTKELCWYRNTLNEFRLESGSVFDVNSKELFDVLDIVAQTFDAIEPRISSLWDEKYSFMLNEKYKVDVAYIGNKCVYKHNQVPKSYLIENSITLLAAFFYGVIGE